MATGGARAPSDADLNEWYGRVFSESKWIEFLMLLDVSTSSQLYNLSDTVRRLLDSADFGVKDFCCIKIVKAASSKREWEIVETTIAKAEAFSAQDECRKIAIRRLLDQSPTDSEWDYIKKFLVAKTEAGIKDSCYFEAMKKAAAYRRPELILELMDIVDSSDNIEECFQTALTSAKSAEDSKKFVAQLLDKVKYQESNIVLRCYTRAIMFAFTLDSGMRNAKSDRKSKSENHWSWILQLICCAIKHRDLPAAKGYDLLKIFLKEAIRKLSWSEVCQTLDIIFHYNTEHHELPFTIKNGWLKIVLNGAIRNSNWSVICQILEIIFRFVERQKLPVATKNDWLNFILTEAIRHSNWSVVCQILSILGTTDNFDPLQKVQTLNENKNISELLEKLKTIDKIEWAISVTLIHYFAQEKQNIALTDEIVLILTEEVLHLDRSLDRVVKERMGPFNIIKILDKSRHINDFLRRVSSCTKSRGDLKNHLLLQYLRPESEPIHSVGRVRSPCGHSRLSYGFAEAGIQSFNRHQEKCTSTTCHCGSKDRCIPKLIESAASKYDWQDVLEIVRHNNSYAKVATDAYLKMFNKNNQNDVKEYLEMIKLSVVHIESENDWEYIIKILRLIDTPTSKCQGFVTAVNTAFQHHKSELALKLVDSAQVENIKVCPIFKDQLRIERYSASNSSKLKQLINELTNRICPRWNYQRLGSADIEPGGFQASSMCICHPTRNSLCDQLWPAALIENMEDRNWKLVLLLLTEVTDADDRDQKCLQLLPEAIERNKARIACGILRFVSKELTRKRDHFCSKISNIIGKGETVALLISLIRLASTKKVIKHCHFRAFIGALRTRNFSMILYIVRSKFRPDFTHPDILHFLANEALLGDFELIKLIFGELKRCAQENFGIDIQFSRECHDMIAAVLFKSMSEGHVALASAILEYADIHYRTKDSEQPFELETTLLIAAAHCGHHELAEQILAQQAPVDEKDSQGRTALSWASIWGHIKTVKTLIDNGARIMHKDNDDATCIQLATLHHQSDVLKLLLHHDERTQVDSDRKYKQMSLRLHKSLCDAGFTEQRAKVLQQMADCLQKLARDLTKEDWHLTGSYSDGVGNSLVQVNGRTASDSDIDWTVIIRPSIKDWNEEEEDEEEEDKEEGDEEEDRARNLKKLTFHLMGHCKCDDTPEELERSIVRDGHAETKRPAGTV
uniref:ANK_REP_REGION domain-containing protein n=1 Tax=Macrostomum lignano TaxID=282301 RepID=A0A1I8G348_9PLAT